MCPYGNSPSLINAWKPLQTPRTKPSRLYSKDSKASAKAGLRNKVAINFPDPSGSSPALKPPGNIIICACPMRFFISSMESSKACGVSLRIIKVSVTAPAASKASAESYSQFVPGQTGIKTRGLPNDSLRFGPYVV